MLELEELEKIVKMDSLKAFELQKQQELSVLRDEIDNLNSKHETAAMRFKLANDEMLTRMTKAETEATELRIKVHNFSEVENKWSYKLKQAQKKADQLREITCMQFEEIAMVKERVEESTDFISQLTTKIHREKDPKKELFNKQMIETYMGREDEILQQLKVENESQLNFARKIIEREFIHNPEETINFYQKFPIKSFEELRPKLKINIFGFQKESTKNGEKFLEKNTISHLKLAKPNMFEIIRSRAINMEDHEIKKLLNVTFDLYGLVKAVRGMMDSWWNMTQLYTEPQQWPSFCEFSYVWIGSYFVNPVSCSVSEAGLTPADADLERIRLILQLNTSFFQKHWECQAFSDFINSKNTVDEVFFYHCCRDLLNQGASLNNRKNCFELVQREEYKKLLPTINKILLKFPTHDTATIISRLELATVSKTNNKLYIDLGFVLRVLLELYKADKRMRYEYLLKDLEVEERVFSMLPKKGNSQSSGEETSYLASYENFRKYIDKHFSFISETEKLMLFSDCFNIGGGNITFETLFTIIHEWGLLVKDLKIRQFVLDESEKDKKNEEPSENQRMFNQLKANRNNEYSFRDLFIGRVENLGVESYSHDIKVLEAGVEGTKYVWGWKDTILNFTRLMNLRSTLNALLVGHFTKESRMKFIDSILQDLSESYFKVLEYSKKYQLHKRSSDMAIERAALKIIEWTKNRLGNKNFYKFMSVLLNFSQKHNVNISGALNRKNTLPKIN